jgi:hypothetical protein
MDWTVIRTINTRTIGPLARNPAGHKTKTGHYKAKTKINKNKKMDVFFLNSFHCLNLPFILNKYEFKKYNTLNMMHAMKSKY